MRALLAVVVVLVCAQRLETARPMLPSVTPAATFDAARRAQFVLVDADGSGKLEHEAELRALYEQTWEVQQLHKTADAFVAAFSRPDTLLNATSFADLSAASLLHLFGETESATVADPATEAANLKQAALALNGLHHFEEAVKVLRDLDSRHPTAWPLADIERHADSLSNAARYLEATTLWSHVEPRRAQTSEDPKLALIQQSVEKWKQRVTELPPKAPPLPPPPPSGKNRNSKTAQPAAPKCGRRPPGFNPSDLMVNLAFKPGCPRVDIAELASPRDFYNRFINTSTPVVITGLTPIDRSDWTHSKLLNTVTDAIVPVFATQTAERLVYSDEYDAATGWTRYTILPAVEHMRFEDYMTVAERASNKVWFSMDDVNIDAWLGKLGPKAPWPELGGELTRSARTLSAGAGGTSARIQPVQHEALVVPVAGHQEVFLFPPTDDVYLEYDETPVKQAKFQFPETITTEATDKPRPKVAAINLFMQAINEHMQKTTPQRCVVRPGEMLYVPAFWHEQSVSHPDESECETQPLSSIALRFKYQAWRSPTATNALLEQQREKARQEAADTNDDPTHEQPQAVRAGSPPQGKQSGHAPDEL